MSIRVRTDPLFIAAGEMAQRMGAFRWEHTPLGAPRDWPPPLRFLVRLVLAAKTPMCLTWGPESTLLYNDAFASTVLGRRHPGALARPVLEVWGETWNRIGAAQGETMPLLVERRDAACEAYVRFTCVPAGSGPGVMEATGMLWLAEDETSAVIVDRRAAALAALDAGLVHVASPDDVMAAVGHASSSDLHDLPFVLIYEPAGDGLHLAAHCGLSPGEIRDLPADLMQQLTGHVSDDVPLQPVVATSPAGISWPEGPWGRRVRQLVCVPLVAPGTGVPVGVLLAGLNPLVPVDEGYLRFLRVFGTLVAAALSTVRAHVPGAPDMSGEFLTSLGHRLRTPLNTILAWSQLLQQTRDAGDRQRGIDTITRSARAQAQMLDEMFGAGAHPTPREGKSDAAPPAAAGQTGVDLSGLAILVVDDDDDARTATKRILERAGAEVTEAGSGAEGLAQLQGQEFDLIVSDVTMPGMDGRAFIREVRKHSHTRTVPAVALTSLVSAEDVAESLRSGFHRHLAKPADALVLPPVLAELTGRHRRQSH